jgi:hypothetical protein
VHWETSTLLGAFALDAAWRQVGHRITTVRWLDGRMVPIAPMTWHQALFNLGLLLKDHGDPAGGAKAAYQQAIDSGHPEAAAAAQQALQNLAEPGHA